MAPAVVTRSRPAADRDSTSPGPSTATRQNQRRNGTSVIIEEFQDIKDPHEGRKYLEKHSLLCPPGEPPSHQLLSICLHQISAMAGLQKPVINAIRSVAFLLDEMEVSQINLTVKEAFDSQITEFTSDMHTLIEDAKEKIDSHIRIAEERLAQLPTPQATQHKPPMPGSYASVLINPPAHANPRVAAREGIRARQFAFAGIKNSEFSRFDSPQLKAELNKILLDLGLTTGKVRIVTSARNGDTIIEADSDEAARWFANDENQRRLCDRIGANTEFRNRAYNVIAFNVPIALEPDNTDHRLEICEANNLDTEPATISTIKWVKAVEKRSLNQRTAHLSLTFTNADAANRAITNGLIICNRKCHVEKSKREPLRCLKCQGWNHYAKECTSEQDRCANCAEGHRTNSCQSTEKRCASCNSKDHASWSRLCPVFLRKMEEFNLRSPENSLQFFPTADPWTWTPTLSSRNSHMHTTPRLATNHTQTKPSSNQIGKRPQHMQHPQQSRQEWDTYIPRYSNQPDSYIPNYSKQPNSSSHTAPPGWWDNPGPGPSRPPAPTKTSGSGPSNSGNAANQAPSNSSPNPTPPINA